MYDNQKLLRATYTAVDVYTREKKRNEQLSFPRSE